MEKRIRLGGVNLRGRHAVEKIHEESMSILEGIGVRVEHSGMCELLAEAGATVDAGTRLVRLPEKLVLDAIDFAPKEFAFQDRIGRMLPIRAGESILGAAGMATEVVDLDTHEIRSVTEKDTADLTRLADHMPNLSINGAIAIASDIPKELVGLHALEALFLNTSKHCFLSPSTLEEAQLSIELAERLCPGRDLASHPIISASVSTTAPLQFPEDRAQMLLYIASKGVPLGVEGAPIGGSTHDTTMADLVVRQNAEFLLSLTTIELVRRGTPVLYGATSFATALQPNETLSMRYLKDTLLITATAAMAKLYGIPSYGKVMQTRSLETDQQAAIEKSLLVLAALMSGMCLLFGAGQLAAGTIASYEQLLIDDELFRVCARFAKPIRVDADTMAVETVAKVGPGGHYVMEDHTLRWMRDEDEYYRSPIFRYHGVAKEGKSMLERVQELVRDMLATHSPQVSDAHLIRDFARSKEAEIMAQHS